MKSRLESIKKDGFAKLINRLEPENYYIDGEDIRLKGEFYQKQTRLVLRNCGIIDPASIEEYIGRDGYFALEKAIYDMTREEIIKVVTDSGLRGRGGAGFPAGRKWETAYKQDTDTKYIICNADEGDPGAFMDRSVLENDPHSVLEAMAICARAVGASQGFIYVRAEYPKAVKALRRAIEDAKKYNLLGENILGSDFSFDIDLRLGAGAFVCGEGTALMESIEGKRGQPRNKEFRTTVKGLWGKPTVINNVETLANVAQIILKGADYFRAYGTEKSPGTKVFALVGKVKHSGLVEVPMGTTINTIVYDIGKGIQNDKEAKAVQTGGPSGGCIPKSLFDTGCDFESLKEIGSIMGSGGMVVMDEDDCMVDVARFFLEFSVDESCGKCTPCRIGNKRLLEMLDLIVTGKASEETLFKLKELSEIVSETSLCGLGQASPNPVLSTMNYFYDEYLAHVGNVKTCPAKRCKDLLFYEITDTCIGCTKCAKACPVGAVFGKAREVHHIDKKVCIKCGTCMDNCPVKAIVLC
ncbi:NADH-ubiquinone oxidoreductase-F iron-sulfur binding region domain-containing protein [Anaerococcus degeneri]|uniref:4Fe-4S binding protein n=1 Tax=Anaerococcus degeneri TaxID=361500 RepID=A0ABS7YWS6_9FIRM|nr:NADH-ubiquinone oxidoreductase-F iron-sulfur binding region domain-containing protein [Anaerococcus degeneri]MBP2015301.1 NADH:ubiquinone oxidoreductase subunit F (NADH-binding)/Pyruvate/2-oxoacid:ferredoxin oxidoreductase delta subunit [Anaerococcus degeneri]MCA2096197.1 4Fe-4S binding protein [Anaerococcus degeneri]